MKPKPEKYKIKSNAHLERLLDPTALQVFPAFIRNNIVYSMGNSVGHTGTQFPFWRCGPARPKLKPTPELVVIASHPDARIVVIVNGPLHKKSSHRRPFLINYERNKAWNVTRTRRKNDGYVEFRIGKEVKFSKLRRELVDGAKAIFDEWFCQQFD